MAGSRGAVDLDAVLLRPELSRATFSGDNRTVTLLFSVANTPQLYPLPGATRARTYDNRGRLVSDHDLAAGARVRVPAGESSCWSPADWPYSEAVRVQAFRSGRFPGLRLIRADRPCPPGVSGRVDPC